MKKLTAEIVINASREQIWEAITDPQKYPGWACVFHEGSFFEGSWKKNETIRFLIVNKNGQKEGMVSQIAESKHPEYLSIRHLGYVVNGIDDTESKEIGDWAPAFENYSLIELDDQQTRFKIDMDIIDGYYDMFMDLWPKALKKLKEMAEVNS